MVRKAVGQFANFVLLTNEHGLAKVTRRNGLSGGEQTCEGVNEHLTDNQGQHDKQGDI